MALMFQHTSFSPSTPHKTPGHVRIPGHTCWISRSVLVMKLNQQQAPLYGDCILTVRLTEEKELEDGDAVFYLLFAGSTLNHLTSTRKVNSETLETVTPGHDCCERVKLSLCASKNGFSVVVAEDSFDFVQDEAYDSAQFLAANAGNQQALIFARFLDRSRPSSGDVTVLDEKITLAFRHLHLPSSWNVLGETPVTKDDQLQETLMHFAARLGLCRLSKFLLEQPGGRRALNIQNSEGATPLSLAMDRGFLRLNHLLTEEETGQQDFCIEDSHIERLGEICVKHHCKLNVYTLTEKSEPEAQTDMEKKIEELRTYIQSHSNCPGVSVNTEMESVSEQTTDVCSIQHNVENSLVDKSMNSVSFLPRDSNDADTTNLILVEAFNKEDCKNEKSKENCTELNLLETLGGEVTVFSFESKNKDTETKEEEEGLVPIVEAETKSATSDRIQSSSTEPHTTGNHLSGGNPNEEIGMTSTAIVLDQEGLCERDSTSQEMITTKERSTLNPSVEEAKIQPSDLPQAIDANMGQAMSGYCTSNSNTIESQSCTENSDQEIVVTESLVNLLSDGDKTSVDDSNENSSQEIDLPLLPCSHSESLETTDFTKENGFTFIDVSGQVENQSNTEMPQEKCVDVLDESLDLTSESGFPHVVASSQNLEDLQLSKDFGPMLPPLPEPSPADVAEAECNVSVTESSEDITQNIRDTLDISESKPQMDFLEEEMEQTFKIVELNEPEIKTDSIQTANEENSATAELSCSSCLENTQYQETGVNQKTELEETDGSLITCGPEPCNRNNDNTEESTNSVPDVLNQSHTIPSTESCVAEVLQGIITEVETILSPVCVENKEQQIMPCVENVKLPSAGKPELLHDEINVCAEGKLNLDSDTPLLFNNNECLLNQEVLSEHSLLSNASTEMQESVVTTTCQLNNVSASQQQATTCEQDNKEEISNAVKIETNIHGAQDDVLCLSLLNQTEMPVSDINCQLPSEEGTKLCLDFKPCTSINNQAEPNESECTVSKGSAEMMVESKVEVTQAMSPNNILDLGTSCLVSSEKEELEDVVKDSSVAYDSDDEDSEIKVSRASLHPIAEESLPNEDYGDSDTSSQSSDNETSSSLSDSDKTLESDVDETSTAKQPVDSVDCLCTGEAAAVTVIKSPNGTPDGENIAVSRILPNAFTQSFDHLHDELNDVPDSGDVSGPLKDEDSGLDLSVNMEETAVHTIPDTNISENATVKAEDEVDFVKSLASSYKINRESCCPIDPCSHTDLLGSKQSNDTADCQQIVEDGLGTESSSRQMLTRDSVSDADLICVPPEILDEMVFTKLEEQSLCDATSSCSSTDDTTSLGRNSSRGSDISLPPGLNLKRHKDRHSLDSCCSSTVTASVEERESEHTEVSELEGEEMDSITEVSAASSRSKSSMRSLSPFRRHSWEPGKPSGSDTGINRRSSLRALGDVVRRPSAHRRSYSLEGLAGDAEDSQSPTSTLESSNSSSRNFRGRQNYEGEDRGSLVSLTEEEQESDQRSKRTFQQKDCERSHMRGLIYSSSAPPPHLTKSMSLSTISHPTTESSRSLSITSSSLSQSISEESCNHLPPSPSRKEELKGGTKVSRTFSYLRNKMSSGKKTKEKEKEKTKEKDPKEKEKDKKTINGHLFSSMPIVAPITCNNCSKGFSGKDGYLCANCNSIVHKACRESYFTCTKFKMKNQKVLQANDTSSLPVVMRNKGSQPKERPRSAIVAPDENTFSALITTRRPQTLSISKSISTQNIAGVGCDESLLGTWKFLSQSTDSLHKICKVNESMESLIDEGMDLNEGQLMGDFEIDSKQLEAESWSQVVDSKFLRQHKKDVVKRQDVIYELMQTEMHHVRTLKIMSDVYSRGMMTELQFEQTMIDKMFPCLDDLLNIHSQYFQQILERKKESMVEKSDKNFVINRIGDILVNQFSGENAERMKKTYGKFCGHHNEAVNYYKDILSKEKRFQAFIKKKMSSGVVRRLGIPECILLVTQRITKYPVLLQRILQYTKENDVEHKDVAQSLNLVKDVITAVNSEVNEYEKEMRLHEIYSRTDSKSIQRMKSGQMFAKEDLKRWKLIRDGSVFLKSSAGRLKDVLAVLLSGILVFLQEKDQKYVFASLDQKSTVISLKKLIVREVAHEEKGLFLITMGVKDPEMVEVHASSKEERNSWIQTIQDTMNTMHKDEDEGVPSESEEERRILDTKTKELKDQLHLKDKQIITLLEEKHKIFQSLTDCFLNEDSPPSVTSRILFRANTEEAQRGEPVMKSAMKEVETLQTLVNKNLWGNVGQHIPSPADTDPSVGPISLPRRAETFGGFDSHQLSASKTGEKEDGEDTQDLRRTESDSVLKKGVNASLIFKRNSEQVLQSVTTLHSLLSTLHAVVLQQDSYIEDQKMHLSEKALTRTFSRPNSLIEQEKQRSLEKQRQDFANLQKQQAQHVEEKRKREREWDIREKELTERETRLAQREELASKGLQEMEHEKSELQSRKDEYQRDLERLRAAQKQLEKEREQFKKDMEGLSEKKRTDLNQVSTQHDKLSKVPSLPAGMESKWHSSGSPKQEPLETELSASPKRDSLLRTDSKQKGKTHFLWHGTNQTNKVSKPKDKKEKKKGKGGRSPTTDTHCVAGATPEEEIFC
ncbi:A-kinase anchor 13 isoform X6 [Pelobates cultripes]|uniref:A-kinase anchor 13 isoform X6 n=3 Tax=Pelobates cultripes TaxID=61616 RepID=A0AAD1RLY9_PELCU|nr:A-kinase anchor 13 isoform X6 [Pelobates cultripes]